MYIDADVNGGQGSKEKERINIILKVITGNGNRLRVKRELWVSENISQNTQVDRHVCI